MITDRIQIAGIESYFKVPADPAIPGIINLAPIAPVAARTLSLNKGKQLDVSAIQLLIQGNDLGKLFSFPVDDSSGTAIPIEKPLFRLRIMKEMFAGLFADPYSNRVHNIAGNVDFEEGTLTNGIIMEINGIPTICSTGKEPCTWVSREYEMPDIMSIAAIAWELATDRNTPPDSFHYKLILSCKDESGASLAPITIDDGSGGMVRADAKRAIDGLTIENIKSFQITFIARVFIDSNLKERHKPSVSNNAGKFFENIGRPLLRAINILEPVKSALDFHSLSELQNLCSDFHLFEQPGPEIKRLTATLDINSVLVNSRNEDLAKGVYEYIEIALMQPGVFEKFEARRIGNILLRNE